MSTTNIISTVINRQHTKENVETILHHGLSIGCTYYSLSPDNYARNFQELQPQNAVTLIWDRLTSQYEFGPCILIKYNETFFCLWFHKTDTNKIDINIGGFWKKWDQEFDYAMTLIDYEKYITFLLKLTTGNIILNLEAYMF